MKLRIRRASLVRAISVVAHSLPSHPPIPILAGVLIRATGDTVTVAAFDHEVSSCAVVAEAIVDEPGAVLISGRLLAEIAKALPARPIEISEGGSHLHMVSGSARFALPLMTIDDYPALPDAAAPRGTVDGAAFAEAVARATVAAGRDDTLPMLTGVHLEFHGATLRLVCTDRFRIAVQELDWQPANHDRSAALLVPARALADAAKTFLGEGIELGGAATGSVLSLSSPTQHHTTRLLDMPYAPYERYLADEHTTLARIDTTALVEAIKRVALLSAHTSRIHLTFADSAVRLTAGDDTGGRAEESLPADLTGDPVTTAFNPRWLLDAVQVARTSPIEIGLIGPTRAATFRPVGGASAGHRRLHILVPIRLPG
ncbi:DNA polymerase III subunit beta [Nocardia sp. NPDC051570]|uniref:DNA polymerase III subunit beta n=1 Tax=Nocardia sp. NPDC051570 TaxID=3364324 RepID=UPI003793CAC6